MIKESVSTVGNQAYQFAQFKQNQVNLIMFICNHCPYVLYRMPAISQLVDDYKDAINIVAINSNDSSPSTYDSHPEDAPEYMPAFKIKHNLNCEYIFDADQSLAKQYNIQCTPEFVLTDKNGIVVYHGELDPSRKTNQLKSTGSSLRHAIELTVVGQKLTWHPAASFGCSIKWKETL